jgi:hypothetical protein
MKPRTNYTYLQVLGYVQPPYLLFGETVDEMVGAGQLRRAVVNTGLLCVV